MVLFLRKNKKSDNNDSNIIQSTSTVQNQLDHFIEIDAASSLISQTSRLCHKR